MGQLVLATGFTQTIGIPGNVDNGERHICSEFPEGRFVSLVSSGSKISTNSDDGKISATSQNKLYLSFSQGGCEKVKGKLKDIELGSFEKLNFPAFGFTSPLTYKISLILEYPHLDFVNATRVKDGVKLLIRNLGKKDGKTLMGTGAR